jgi:hypothetical protein
MKQRVRHTIIGILSALGAATVAVAQATDAQPPKAPPTPSLVVPPPSQPPTTGKAQLAFEEMEHDFGRMWTRWSSSPARRASSA